MWRRVASSSPDQAGASTLDYLKSNAAFTHLLRSGESLSGRERNRLFLNLGGHTPGHVARFANASAVSGIDFEDDSRCYGLVDADFDGDVDAWQYSRTAPRLRLMRNDAAPPGRFVAVRLQGTRTNRDALGAVLTLQVSSGEMQALHREVRSMDAFATQSTQWVHFGLGKKGVPGELTIRWPGGASESISGLKAGAFYDIAEGAGKAKPWQPPATPSALKPLPVPPEDRTARGRLVLTGRLPVPPLPSQPIPGSSAPPAAGARLIMLWSATCYECEGQLEKLATAAPALAKAGIGISLLNVDVLADAPQGSLAPAADFLKKHGCGSLPAAAITPETAGLLDIFCRAYVGLRLPHPVPASLLVDSRGCIAVIYRGLLKPETLLADIALLNLPMAELAKAASPFPGTWLDLPGAGAPDSQVLALMREGYVREAAAYAGTWLDAAKAGTLPQQPGTNPVPRAGHALLGEKLTDCHRLLGDKEGVVSSALLALEFDPEHLPSLLTLGRSYAQRGNPAAGLRFLLAARKLAPASAEVLNDTGIALAMSGRVAEAEAAFREALATSPGHVDAHINLARCLEQRGASAEAMETCRKVLQLQPGNSTALYQLASAHLARKEPAEAVRLAIRLTELDSGPWPLHLLASAHLAAGQKEQAAAVIQRGLAAAKESRNAKATAALEQLGAKAK